MGLILTVKWDSDEKNADYLHKLQELAEPQFGHIQIDPSANQFVIKRVTRGCGTCGNITQSCKGALEEFGRRASEEVLHGAKNVTVNIRDANAEELR